MRNFLESHIEEKERFLIVDDICGSIATSFMVRYGPDYVLNQLLKVFNKELMVKESDVHEFIPLLINAHNNTRRCDLRGFTPVEVRQGVKTKPYKY